jgi:hypothetical protein
MAGAMSEAQMVEQFRGRLGDGQALTLLSGYYGRPLTAPLKPAAPKVAA